MPPCVSVATWLHTRTAASCYKYEYIRGTCYSCTTDQVCCYRRACMLCMYALYRTRAGINMRHESLRCISYPTTHLVIGHTKAWAAGNTEKNTAPTKAVIDALILTPLYDCRDQRTRALKSSQCWWPLCGSLLPFLRTRKPSRKH